MEDKPLGNHYMSPELSFIVIFLVGVVIFLLLHLYIIVGLLEALVVVVGYSFIAVYTTLAMYIVLIGVPVLMIWLLYKGYKRVKR